MFRLIAVGVLFALVLSFKAKPLNDKTITSNKKECVLEDLSTAGLGDVKHSILSETAFQAVNGEEWVLLAGQNKTDLSITTEDSVFDHLNLTDNISIDNLPDSRGVFLRGKNNTDQLSALNNPDGDIQIGLHDGDAIRNITAQTGFASDGNGSAGVGPYRLTGAFKGVGGTNAHIGDKSGGRAGFGSLALDASLVVPTAGDNRPKNITVNTFVKIKLGCLDAVALAERRAAEARVQALEDYLVKSSCNECFEDAEGSLAEQQAKAGCFKGEVDAYESSTKEWSISCLSIVIGYTKKLLMTIGEDRTSDETEFLTHLDNQYPYYNVIETAKK